MPDAVIVAAARTPIGTARKGTLLDVSAFDLAKYAVGEALKRSGVDPGDVDDLQMGESLQGGGDIARYAAIELGLHRSAGRRAQPALRVGHGVGAGRGGQHHRRHGPGRDRRWRRVDLHLAADDEAHARHRRL